MRGKQRYVRRSVRLCDREIHGISETLFRVGRKASLFKKFSIIHPLAFMIRA
jgi:hypothetical protein